MPSEFKIFLPAEQFKLDVALKCKTHFSLSIKKYLLSKGLEQRCL